MKFRDFTISINFEQYKKKKKLKIMITNFWYISMAIKIIYYEHGVKFLVTNIIFSHIKPFKNKKV